MLLFNTAYQFDKKSRSYTDEVLFSEGNLGTLLSVSEEGSAENESANDPLVACAKIFQIHQNLSSPWKDQPAFLSCAKIAELLRQATGYSCSSVALIIANMERLGLVALIKNNSDVQIMLLTNDIVSKAKEISRLIQEKTGEQLHPEDEYLVLDEMMDVTGRGQSALMGKLSQGELPESAVMLRESELALILAEDDYCMEDVTIEDTIEIHALDTIDNQTLQLALGRMSSLEIANLVKNTAGTTCNRILACLSRKRKSSITDIVADLDEMDTDEFMRLVDEFLQLIKQISHG